MTAPASTVPVVNSEQHFWLQRASKTIFFFLLILTLAGVYAAFQVPISVFSDTNFPRVVIGVDNGVMPVEQMQVTITKPIEDAINSVPGLLIVRSTTSRGSAEISLFFDWSVDMYQTLQLTDAALADVERLELFAKATTVFIIPPKERAVSLNSIVLPSFSASSCSIICGYDSTAVQFTVQYCAVKNCTVFANN